LIEIDDGRWPLVTVFQRGRYTVADATAHVVAFDGFFRRAEPFAYAIVYGDELAASEAREQGVNPILTRWLRASHGLLTEYCRGIATVVPFRKERATKEARVVDMGRAFGCPFALFATRAEAETWLRDRLVAAAPVAATGPTAETAR
jgi:hypothetical protein